MNNEQYKILTNKIDRIVLMVEGIYKHLKIDKIKSPLDLRKAPGINNTLTNLPDTDEQEEDTSGHIQKSPGIE